MKRSLSLLVLTLLSPAYALARDVTTRLTVSDMHCPACPPAVTKALKQVSGVRDVTVSVAEGTPTVVANESVSSSALIDAVAKAGFSATVASEN